MATYVGLVLKTAFTQWDKRTDLMSGVIGALAPCGYLVTGRPVPENVSVLIAEIAVGIVAGTIIVRLIAAPYLIWQSDQVKIKELQRKLDDPKRLRKEALEQATLQARSDFAIEMRKYLDGYNAGFVVHSYSEQVFEWLNSHAVLFSHDTVFQDMWTEFVYVFERERSVKKIKLDIPDPDGFIEVNLNRNINLYFSTRRILARHIIAYLMYDESIKEDWLTEVHRIKKNYDDIGIIEFHDETSLAVALARRSLQSTGSGIQP